MIMSHDQFGKIPQSPEMQQQILQAELDTVEENLEVLKQQGHDVSRGMLKGLIKRKENLTAKIATIQYQMDQNKDAVADFKQMGIDHIFCGRVAPVQEPDVQYPTRPCGGIRQPRSLHSVR